MLADVGMLAPAIELQHVSKTYGRPGKQRPALADVSIRVEQGEFALLMGPSGAGKSTLLELILALEQPDQGSIRVAGRDVHRLTKASIPYLRRNLGAVFQDFDPKTGSSARWDRRAPHGDILSGNEAGRRTMWRIREQDRGGQTNSLPGMGNEMIGA